MSCGGNGEASDNEPARDAVLFASRFPFSRMTGHRLTLLRFGIPSLCLVMGLVMACDRPTRPSDNRSNLTGTWDVSFTGTAQGQGTSQRDTFVMELQHEGSRVTGMLRISGHEFPLSGTVTGASFIYAVAGRLEPNCAVSVSAETTFDATGARFSGSQTQSTCEGTAVGQVTGTKR